MNNSTRREKQKSGGKSISIGMLQFKRVITVAHEILPNVTSLDQLRSQTLLLGRLPIYSSGSYPFLFVCCCLLLFLFVTSFGLFFLCRVALATETNWFLPTISPFPNFCVANCRAGSVELSRHILLLQPFNFYHRQPRDLDLSNS